MNTENTDSRKRKGWIFYDAACALCARGRHRAGRLFESRGFAWTPLQTPGAATRLDVPESDFNFRMHLLMADGRVWHNADALGVLCRSVWWLWPLGLLLLVPGFREFGRITYDWFARNRYCIGGGCHVDTRQHGRITLFDCAIAFLLPLVAASACWKQPAWLLMWALVAATGCAFKWLTWRDAIARGACPSARRAFVWFALWPGTDGRAFFLDDETHRPAAREWFWAGIISIVGASLIWVAVPVVRPGSAMSAAWIGMLGIVLVLHFGAFRWLSLILRRFGVKTPPIMNAPLRATSLAEFWGARWNTAFSIPARRLLLRPLARRIGLAAAGFAVFLISGLLHELVISLPARAGFGLPTLYFVLQGAGVAFERSRVGRKWGLGKGARGWGFVMIFTVAPLYWLFHPAFALRVVIPFLDVLTLS